MMGVVIHEVGHSFMIVNSDERQWTWMDEGLNSFMEFMENELGLIFLQDEVLQRTLYLI
jgi:hypothetical protein